MEIQYLEDGLYIETGFRSSFQYIDHLSRYRDSHCKDETVVRPSYLLNGNIYTGKTASLYWDGLLDLKRGIFDWLNTK